MFRFIMMNRLYIKLLDKWELLRVQPTITQSL